MRLTEHAPSGPARLERSSVRAIAGRSTEVASLDGGRWSSCLAVLEVPTAWAAGDHAVRLVARLGSARTELATTAARLDWTPLGSMQAARLDLAGVVADGYHLEIEPDGSALEGARVTLEARGADDAADAATQAEQLDQTISPRRGPLVGVVAYGLAPSGDLEPIACDEDGALA